VDIKAIRSPIIVFASRGDNITPPQQALNWIPATYADVEEIRIRGQRIVYMVHPEVGHLGIFVSGGIAKKEHTEMASVMEAIEALAPGLYEMRIETAEGTGSDRRFTVSLDERDLSDLAGLDDGRRDERPFAAVARFSEAQADFYDAAVRPFVKAMVTPAAAEAGRALHPSRVQRRALASGTPAGALLKAMAGTVRASRHPVGRDNPFAAMEAATADLIEQAIDATRDLRDMAYELTFFALWGNPWARAYGWTHAAPRTLKNPAELRGLPEAQMALARVAEGGFAEAVIRMLVLLAESRGGVRRDRLARSAAVLTGDEPFASMNPEVRARIIREQTLIASLAPEEAVATLPTLLPDPAERAKALAVVRYIPGRLDEMAPHTVETLQTFARTLGLPPVTEDVLVDPLAS
jgi:tellurite resistance protein